jgi:ubiquinone/menaquinone biosynthesis C-methylase UbiE
VTGRSRALVMILGAGAACAAIVAVVRHVVRHGHGAAKGREEQGGILIDDASAYDAMSRLFFGSLFGPIAADVAALAEATAPEGARVLEVGCGPGHLSFRLARRHGLDTTGLDLDPAMIERARTNADRAGEGDERRPSFLVGAVASMPFPDETFDLVVSTMSMHHWTDPAVGLTEMVRVLRPGSRALVWDFRSGFVPLHGHLPDPVEHTRGTPLRVVSATPWRWPWRFNLTQRIELVHAGE